MYLRFTFYSKSYGGFYINGEIILPMEFVNFGSLYDLLKKDDERKIQPIILGFIIY